MQFLSPTWLFMLLVPIIGVIVAYFARGHSQKRWGAFVSSSRLAERLINRESPTPWWISITLLCLGIALIVIALAEPYDGKSQTKLPTKGRNIYLAVDLSRSMLVEDVSPNRLIKAKTLGIEIIESLPTEKIGIISFAGKAWLEAPLTTDHDVLKETMLSLNENTIPYGGSDSSPLMELVSGLLPEEEQTSEALLIILSDGELHQEPQEREIKSLRENGVKIFTIGVGTSNGGIVPDKRQPDGYFRDRKRRTVQSALQTETLEKIAFYGNGESFIDANYDFIPRLRYALAGMQGELSENANTVTQYNHLFMFFLIPGMIALFLSGIVPSLWRLIRVSSPLVATALIIGLPQPAEAVPLLVSYQSGESLMAQEQYTEAATAYGEALQKARGENAKRLQFSKGVAEYRGQLYEDALQSFSQSLLSDSPELQTEAHYNLGNTLYRKGQADLEAVAQLKSMEQILLQRESVINQWKDALKHYRSALYLTPENANAKDNYDLVKKKLDELQESQDQLKELLQEMQEGEGEGEPQDGEEGEGEDSGQQGDGDGDNQEEGMTNEELEEKIKEGKKQGNKKQDKGAPQEEGNSQPQPQKESELLKDRRPGESLQDQAQRLLEENSDIESGNLRTGRQRFFSQPSKDW